MNRLFRKNKKEVRQKGGFKVVDLVIPNAHWKTGTHKECSDWIRNAYLKFPGRCQTYRVQPND